MVHNMKVDGGYQKYHQIEMKDINLSDPKQSMKNKGSSNMYINGPDNKPVFFEIASADYPHYTILFSPRVDGEKVSICLTVCNQDDRMMKFFSDLDELIIKHIADNSKEFLKSVQSVEKVREKFTSPLRKNEEYNNQFLSTKIDLAGKNGCEYECWEVNEAKARYAAITHESLEKGDRVNCILKLGLIYSINQRCGYTLDVVNIGKLAKQKIEKFPFFSTSASKFVECDQTSLFEECDIEPMDQDEAPPEDPGTDKTENDYEVEEDNGATIEIDPCTLEPMKPSKKRRKGDKAVA